jgi:hypothetical protein
LRTSCQAGTRVTGRVADRPQDPSICAGRHE